MGILTVLFHTELRGNNAEHALFFIGKTWRWQKEYIDIYGSCANRQSGCVKNCKENCQVGVNTFIENILGYEGRMSAFPKPC